MMTLGNMRQQGVRSLSITCGAVRCHHGATTGFNKADIVSYIGTPRSLHN